jgi:hypothetical protein
VRAWTWRRALATALKDLDRSTRLFVIALGLFAIAGATVGVENLAAAIEAIPEK